jgi:uncharacterized membrane-anchored protein
MQQCHVPRLGARYWIALCLASVFGANMGDFFAHDIGLGHVAGLPFLAVALAAVFVVERFDRAVHETYYWLAIVIVRTAATNLADFLSVDLRLPKPWVMAGLAALLALSVAAAWRLVWRHRPDNNDAQGNLLRADYGYWLAMLIAGTTGTVMGDFFSHAWRGLWPLPLYWATIVMIRAAGTTVGDLVAARHALGLPLSTAVTGVLFVGFLVLWRGAKRETAAAEA